MKQWSALVECKPQHLSKRKAQATNICCMNAFIGKGFQGKQDWTGLKRLFCLSTLKL